MAADEVRLLLAYTLWHYDIALEGGSTRPKNMTFNRFCFPDMSASITLTARDYKLDSDSPQSAMSLDSGREN